MTNSQPCDFCGNRPATLFGISVPIWRVFGGPRIGESPRAELHDLCRVCHDMTFPERARERNAAAYDEAARRLDVALRSVVEDAARAPSMPHMRRLVRLSHRIERTGDRCRAIAGILAWRDRAAQAAARGTG